MKYIHYKYNLFLPLMVWILAVACTKEDDPQPADKTPPEEEIPFEEEEASDGLFYQLIRIENLATEVSVNLEDDSPTVPRETIYFSLEDSTVIRDLYVKTNRWDLAFGHLFNSFLSGNNGGDPENYGYGANGTGGILILEQHFDEVIDIPPPEAFRTGRDLIGTDEGGAFGLGTGWYLYDFGGTILGDGSYEKKHVAYALPDTRTVVVRTARGNYAKIKMISCYKDAFTPEEWFRNTPHMYFTFEYVLVPADSKQFEIRE